MYRIMLILTIRMLMFLLMSIRGGLFNITVNLPYHPHIYKINMCYE